MSNVITWLISMNFSSRLVRIRKELAYTQQSLADAVNLHVNQIKRYENGSAQPTLETLVRLAKALRISLDELVFDEHERDPTDELRLKFEAIVQMDEEERRSILSLLDAMILKHQTKRFFIPTQTGT
ncbi:helix-turn-helix domain-containing protein [Chitinimonas sp. BJB300]|uniref:helix-turn-helix domain-containing protein n=1 Tax=Chitinimonas sp. BJB300 TaxID=1559339 RepID=UPI000C0D097E|nr:helix-turn-helix transcriptional regulator [Chitinimonas sp. BJB300]PHV09480.1 transcriptional regulator [Chitinimonas sp. BJB300]TSJ83741.1 helix-turn-helix transcriptional regulator [Chitinimonas sp. BJB300]